jgi:predicted AAA+ superfamily ATPase
MKGVTESMAGRAAVFQLLPVSILESDKVTLLRGGYPEVITRPSRAATWFRSYLQTYLERDIRSMSGIRDLVTFRRFIALVASRCGQVLNRTDLAGPLGVSVPTISQWLGLLELTLQIALVPPFFENFGKRLTKSPKIYPLDAGVACYLLGIDSARGLVNSPFAGPLFESFVASEILKLQMAMGRPREIYHFRDQQGLEVDFVVPNGPRRLMLVEAKSSRTATPAMVQPMERLSAAVGGYEVERFLVYQPVKGSGPMSTIKPGALAGSVQDLLKRLSRPQGR